MGHYGRAMSFFTCTLQTIQVDPLTLLSQNGQPTRHHDGHLVALRHYLEPEWQSRHKNLAHAIALSPRPARQRPDGEPQHHPGPPRLSPRWTAPSIDAAPPLAKSDGTETHQRKHGDQ